MIKKYLFLFSLFFIDLFSIPALAKGIVIGLGQKTCQEYAKKDVYKKNEFIVWVQGYVTGYNQVSPATGNLTSGKDFWWVKDWLDQYCASNRDKTFGEAVAAMAEELSGPKAATTIEKN